MYIQDFESYFFFLFGNLPVGTKLRILVIFFTYCLIIYRRFAEIRKSPENFQKGQARTGRNFIGRGSNRRTIFEAGGQILQSPFANWGIPVLSHHWNVGKQRRTRFSKDGNVFGDRSLAALCFEWNCDVWTIKAKGEIYNYRVFHIIINSLVTENFEIKFFNT